LQLCLSQLSTSRLLTPFSATGRSVSALPATQSLVGRAAIVPVIRAALEYGVDVLLSEPDVVRTRELVLKATRPLVC